MRIGAEACHHHRPCKDPPSCKRTPKTDSRQVHNGMTLTAPVRVVAIVALVLLPSFSVFARDCTTSRSFKVLRPQKLAGLLQDPVGAALPGVETQLIINQTVFRSAKANASGHYDFGEIPAGEYKLRIYGNSNFCAPRVSCKPDACRVERLRLNPKIPAVTVY